MSFKQFYDRSKNCPTDRNLFVWLKNERAKILTYFNGKKWRKKIIKNKITAQRKKNKINIKQHKYALYTISFALMSFKNLYKYFIIKQYFDLDYIFTGRPHRKSFHLVFLLCLNLSKMNFIVIRTAN